jgi:hypothetical protein
VTLLLIGSSHAPLGALCAASLKYSGFFFRILLGEHREVRTTHSKSGRLHLFEGAWRRRMLRDGKWCGRKRYRCRSTQFTFKVTCVDRA